MEGTCNEREFGLMKICVTLRRNNALEFKRLCVAACRFWAGQCTLQTGTRLAADVLAIAARGRTYTRAPAWLLRNTRVIASCVTRVMCTSTGGRLVCTAAVKVSGPRFGCGAPPPRSPNRPSPVTASGRLRLPVSGTLQQSRAECLTPLTGSALSHFGGPSPQNEWGLFCE